MTICFQRDACAVFSLPQPYLAVMLRDYSSPEIYYFQYCHTNTFPNATLTCLNNLVLCGPIQRITELRHILPWMENYLSTIFFKTAYMIILALCSFLCEVARSLPISWPELWFRSYPHGSWVRLFRIGQKQVLKYFFSGYHAIRGRGFFPHDTY